MRKAWQFSLLLLLTLSGLAACGSMKKSRVLYERGAEKASIGDYDSAITLYTQSLKASAQDYTVYQARAYARDAVNDYKGAEEDYTDALIVLQRNISHVDPGDGRLKKVMINVERKIADLYYLRAWARYKMNMFDRARHDFDEAIHLVPHDILALFGRGVCRRALGDSISARDDFAELVKLSPRNAEEYSMHGASCLYLEQFSLAISDFDNAIRLNPADKDACFNRGIAKKSLNGVDAGLPDLHKASDMGHTEARKWLIENGHN